jgi:hypothetical protein
MPDRKQTTYAPPPFLRIAFFLFRITHGLAEAWLSPERDVKGAQIAGIAARWRRADGLRGRLRSATDHDDAGERGSSTDTCRAAQKSSALRSAHANLSAGVT